MFELYTTDAGKFRFRLKAGNGQVILISESYESKDGCTNGIESVKENAQNKDNFRLKTASNGEFYFNLIAGNGQTIGTSEMYTSESGRDNGIESVMENAPSAEVVVVE